jgi:XRE family transcriptional regulator, regulator of sulfur utilization
MRHLPLLLSLVAVSAVAADPAAPQPTSVAYAPPARSVPLGSTVVAWDSLRFRASPVGLYCAVFDEPTPTLEKIEVHVTTLNPGMASHTPHHHPWEEMLLVKEGSLEMSINGKKEPAGPGFLVFLASHDVHNITNVGDKPATYYVINFVTAAVHTVRDQPASEWAPPGMLSSRVVDCDSIPDPPKGGHREVLDSPTLTFLRLESHISTLKPGASTTPRNRDPGDELFVVKSGEVEATLNGIASRVGPGSFFYVAPNDERTMRNLGTGPCSYQVFKVVSDRSPQKPGA